MPRSAGRWRELEEHHYHRYLAGELDFLGQRRERVRDFTGPYGLTFAGDPDLDAWWADYSAEYRRAWVLHADALRTLDALADRRIGLITNGELAFQTAKLDAVGLSDRLEHVVASGELGITKPDPRIFRHACDLFGVPPASAAYIGDRLRTDAIGAADAGLTGVWLDRLGAATPDELREASSAGVAVIRSLDELPALLP